ncbi:SusC/RagA family TonB-linked outer membrane protein [Flavobacterium sp. CF136]|uniref:SusC/RagA family TonB-linked outer membrane protein n=1 Tax=Flavobacterium sp. (strain CF136) TaxID=1144313 RepID=UPI0002716BD5|nr:SusC/RagA family TonB-linked outer membrane protein [Flavobacterium sp. CF136]EJL61896.1 TonB-linked outer membrane protein, SusC/RagA family [Flavobacterium sp. CF136]
MKQALIKRCSFILFALMSMLTYAQTASSQIKVTGTVTDNSGGLIPGVNVTEKSSKNTVTTDYNGKYEISVKPGATLVFSFIGMKKIEIPLSGRTTVDAKLHEDSNQLDNIVVVGYTSQKKSHLTSAVESVKMSEITDLPVGDLGTAIQGRVLGVGISGGSTRPGVKSNLTIRQPYSLAKDGGNTNPLYVIDGVLQTTADGLNDSTLFDNLDASEVESISFLKDAAAAIYGSRSGSGVVLVTTKRGTKGDPKFSYSGSYGANDKTYQSKMLNAYEFGQYVNIMNGSNGYNQTSTDPQYFFSQDELDYFKTLQNTYLDDEWKPSYNMRHNLNVSGGSDKATYFAGASYYKQNGNLSTLDYTKWNFRAGTDVKLTNNWKAGLQLSGYYSDQVKTFNKIGGEKEENDYNELLTHIPYIPNYVNGMAIELPGNTDANQRYHYSEIKRLNNLAETTANTMTINMYTEYKVPFVKGLMARGAYARNMGNTRGTQVGTTYTLYQFKGLGANGHIFNDDITDAPIKTTKYSNGDLLLFDNTTILSEQLNFTLSYDRTFGKHSINGLFGIEKAEATSNKERVLKTNVLEGTNGQFNTATGTIDGTTTKNESGSLSYVGRLNYAYDDKYLVEFLYRTDASTKFSPENYWGNFYSASVGWVVSKEDFFDSSVIDFLKFRYSVGLLGKDDTKAWQWRQRYTFQANKGGVFGGNGDMTNGWKMEASPNPDATWSDEVKTNFGIDTRFLNNRLSATAEVYYNIGTNLLMNVTGNLPFTIGGTVAAQNYGKMDTYGYELALGWNDKIGQNTSYGIDLRFGWSGNKLIKGDFNNEDILKPWNPKPGESTDNGVWGYDYLGMFKSQADIDAYVSEYKITAVKNIEGSASYSPSQLKPGMLYYRDIRGAYLGNGQFAAPDGIIDVNDQVRLSRKSNSQYGLGTTLRFAYKSFSLNTVVNASFGGWSEIGSDARKPLKTKIPQIVDNTVSIWNDIYDPTLNPNGSMPNPAFADINSVSSKFWEVDSFRIACRNITLSYALPQKALKAINMSSCKLNFVALNPFNIYNPYSFQEANGSYLDYPTLRTLSLGLNVGF